MYKMVKLRISPVAKEKSGAKEAEEHFDSTVIFGGIRYEREKKYEKMTTLNS